MLYHHRAHPVLLSVEPGLASWDRGGSPGQVRLARFLDHAEAVAAPALVALDGLLAVELTVGLSGQLSLTSGGRDLDNYLFPLAQRLGAGRIAAMFGRKVHGPSFLAVGPAEPNAILRSDPRFLHSRRMESRITGPATENPGGNAGHGTYRHGHGHYHWTRPELGQRLETTHRCLRPCPG